jgi:hypothetical protein
VELVAKTAPEMLKIGEFAGRMRISIWTARQWSYRRRMATCKSGKLLLVPATEVTRLIEEGMRPRHTEEPRIAA